MPSDDTPEKKGTALAPPGPVVYAAKYPEPVLYDRWFGTFRFLLNGYVSELDDTRRLVNAATELVKARAAYVDAAALLEAAELNRWYGVHLQEQKLRLAVTRADELASLDHETELWRRREALAKAQESAVRAGCKVQDRPSHPGGGGNSNEPLASSDPPELRNILQRREKLQAVHAWAERACAAVLATVGGDKSKLSAKQREELAGIEADAYQAEQEIYTQDAAAAAFCFGDEEGR
jgi:hypothetical protein